VLGEGRSSFYSQIENTFRGPSLDLQNQHADMQRAADISVSQQKIYNRHKKTGNIA
jgi:hypothetical protein